MTVQTNSSNKIKGGPDLVLTADDKMYLALAYGEQNRLAFIYTLVCRRMDKASGYYARAEYEVLTFKKSSDAHIYYETLQQIQRYQSTQKDYQGLTLYNKEAIIQFNSQQR